MTLSVIRFCFYRTLTCLIVWYNWINIDTVTVEIALHLLIKQLNNQIYLSFFYGVLSIMPNIPEISGPFRFLPTGIFGITSGGGALISVGIFQQKFAVPFLTNWFFALIREFGKGIKSDKSHAYWLARFNQKMLFHFPRVFPLISDRSVWHNGKHPWYIRVTDHSRKWYLTLSRSFNTKELLTLWTNS